jgi:hypothetical protein
MTTPWNAQFVRHPEMPSVKPMKARLRIMPRISGVVNSLPLPNVLASQHRIPAMMPKSVHASTRFPAVFVLSFVPYARDVVLRLPGAHRERAELYK